MTQLFNQAKLGDGLNESPTVMVGETTTTAQLGKNKGTWAFVETNIVLNFVFVIPILYNYFIDLLLCSRVKH